MKSSQSNHYAMMRADAFVYSTLRELEPLQMALTLSGIAVAKSVKSKNRVGEKIFFKVQLETRIKISNLLS